MNHSFNVELAKKYGIEEAIIIENIAFWQHRNIANNNNFFDNKYWIYNSLSAWQELFPYMTKSKIYRCLEKLEKKEVLYIGCYNKFKFDRTKWYSLNNKLLNAFFKMKHPLSQNEKSHISNINDNTYYNTNINTDINNEQNKFTNNNILKSIETIYIDFMKQLIPDYKYEYGKNRKVINNLIKAYNGQCEDIINEYLKSDVGKKNAYALTNLQQDWVLNKILLKVNKGQSNQKFNFGLEDYK